MKRHSQRFQLWYFGTPLCNVSKEAGGTILETEEEEEREMTRMRKTREDIIGIQVQLPCPFLTTL